MDDINDRAREEQLKNLMGLGNGSIRKSYYPELQNKIDELNIEKNHFKRIFSDAQNGIFHVDMQGRITAANPAMVRLCRYNSLDELLAMENIGNDLFTDKNELDELIREVVKNLVIVGYETRFKTYDGSILDISLNVSKISEEDLEFLEFFVRDITEQKKAQDYIISMINSMPSVLIAVNPEGIISQWNKKAEKAYSIRRQEALGKSIETLLPHLKKDLPLINEAISKNEEIKGIRRTRNLPENQLIEDMTIFPLSGLSSEGAVIRIDDVTDEVRMQEMIIQSEKMLSIGGLAAGMAHEINNPLAGILQTTSVMKKRLMSQTIPGNLKAAEKSGLSLHSLQAYMEDRGIFRMFKAIEDSGKRASEIISNILSFSRKDDQSFSTQNIIELIDSTLQLARTDYNLKKKYDFRNFKIEKCYEENIPSLLCVRSQIQQVILNIINNGAEAMSHWKTAEYSPLFTIRIKKEKTMVFVEIEDNGPGMDEKTRSRVFEPFYTTKPVGIGTGLGLSLSYFIITKNHNGTMVVLSEKGKGTTFKIGLPLDRSLVNLTSN